MNRYEVLFGRSGGGAHEILEVDVRGWMLKEMSDRIIGYSSRAVFWPAATSLLACSMIPGIQDSAWTREITDEGMAL